MYTEIKYLNLLSVRLQLFKKKKEYLWNFRCPICGDSHKSKTKARGFVFTLKGNLMYKCHNCQYAAPFPKLLQELDPGLYKEYKLEKFQDDNTTKKKVDMRKVKRLVSQAPSFTTNILSSLEPLDNLNTSHPAKEYILNRRLPTEALYYTEKFMEWVNSVKPNTFEKVDNDEPRIIIPFIDEEGNVFGFQGRSLSNSGLRYITILLDEEHQKVFGLNRINKENIVYVTEGPFDSLLLSNSVAMCGADVDLSEFNLRSVFVYDNEPRNKQITDRIRRTIDEGHSVVIWPKHIREKDINDMMLAGLPVQEIVESHTYTGLTANLKFNDWKK